MQAPRKAPRRLEVCRGAAALAFVMLAVGCGSAAAAGAAVGDYSFDIVSNAGTAAVGLPFSIQINGPDSSVRALIVDGVCEGAAASGRVLQTATLDGDKQASFAIDTTGTYRVCVADNRHVTLLPAGTVVVSSLNFTPKHLYKGVRLTVSLSEGLPLDAKVYLSTRVRCDHDSSSVIYGPVTAVNRTALFFLQSTQSGYFCVEWPDPKLFTPAPPAGQPGAAQGAEEDQVRINIGRVTVSEPFEFKPPTALRNDEVTLELQTYGFTVHSLMGFSRDSACLPEGFVLPPMMLTGEFGVEADFVVTIPEGSYYVCIEMPPASGEFVPAQGTLGITEFRFSPETIIHSLEERITLGGAVSSPSALVAIHRTTSCLASSRTFGPVSTSQFQVTLVLNTPGLFYLCVKQPDNPRYILAGNLTVSDMFSIEGSEDVVRGIPRAIRLTGGSPMETAVKLSDDDTCGPPVRGSLSQSEGGEVVFRYLVNPGSYAVCVQTKDQSRWIPAGQRVVRDYLLQSTGVLLADRRANLQFESSTPRGGLNLTFVWRDPLVNDGCLMLPSQIGNASVNVTSYPPHDGTSPPSTNIEDVLGGYRPQSDDIVFPKQGIWDLCSSYPTPSVRLTFINIGEVYSFLPKTVLLDSPVVLLFGSGVPRGSLVFISQSTGGSDCAQEKRQLGIDLNSSVASAVREDSAAYFYPTQDNGFGRGNFTLCVESQYTVDGAAEFVRIADTLAVESLEPTRHSFIANLTKEIVLEGFPLNNRIPYSTGDPPEEDPSYRAVYKVISVHPTGGAMPQLSPAVLCNLRPAAQASHGVFIRILSAGVTDVGGAMRLHIRSVSNLTACAAVEVSPYVVLYASSGKEGASFARRRSALFQGDIAEPGVSLPDLKDASSSLFMWMRAAELQVTHPVVVVTPAPASPPPPVGDPGVTVTLSESESSSPVVVAPPPPGEGLGYNARYNPRSLLAEAEVVQGAPFSIQLGGSAYPQMTVRVTQNASCLGGGSPSGVPFFAYDTPLNSSLQASLIVPVLGRVYICSYVISQWVLLSERHVVPMDIRPNFAFIANREPHVVQQSFASTVGLRSVSLYVGGCPAVGSIFNAFEASSPVKVAGPFTPDGDGFFAVYLPERLVGDTRVRTSDAGEIVACGLLEIEDVYLSESFFRFQNGAGRVGHYIPLGLFAGRELPSTAAVGIAFDLNNRNSVAESKTLRRFVPWRIRVDGLSSDGADAAMDYFDSIWSTRSDTAAAAAAAPPPDAGSLVAPLSLDLSEKPESSRYYFGVYVSVKREGASCGLHHILSGGGGGSSSTLWPDDLPNTVKGGERAFYRLKKRRVTGEGAYATPGNTFDEGFAPEDIVLSLNVEEGEGVVVCASYQMVLDMLPASAEAPFSHGGSHASGGVSSSLLRAADPLSGAASPAGGYPAGYPYELMFDMVQVGFQRLDSFLYPTTFQLSTFDAILFRANLLGVHNASAPLPDSIPPEIQLLSPRAVLQGGSIGPSAGASPAEILEPYLARLTPVYLKISSHRSCNTTLFGPALLSVKGMGLALPAGSSEGAGSGGGGGVISSFRNNIQNRAALHDAFPGQFYSEVQLNAMSAYVCLKGTDAFVTSEYRQKVTPAPTPSPDIFGTPVPAEEEQMRLDSATYVEVGRIRAVAPFLIKCPVTLHLVGGAEGGDTAGSPSPPASDPPPSAVPHFVLQVHVPQAQAGLNRGVGDRVKIANNTLCSSSVANGDSRFLSGTARNATFRLPREVTGTVFVCVSTEDGSNWLNSGDVILLGHRLPFQSLVRGVAEAQLVSGFDVTSGYLSLATVPDCGSGTLNVSSHNTHAGAASVTLLSVPILNGTAAVGAGAVPTSWPDTVWGCVSGIPAGQVTLLPAPSFSQGYAPAVERNPVALVLKHSGFPQGSVYARVIHSSLLRGSGGSLSCDQGENFTEFDSNAARAPGAAKGVLTPAPGGGGGGGGGGAAEAATTTLLFTPFPSSGSYVVCLELRSLRFRLRVSAGGFPVTSFFQLRVGGSPASVVPSTRPATLRLPRQVLEFATGASALWNVTLKLGSCGAQSPVVRDSAVTRSDITFAVTNNTLSREVFACVVNRNNGGWFPFSPGDIYAAAFPLRHTWSYTLKRNTVAGGYSTPIVIGNVLQGARITLADLGWLVTTAGRPDAEGVTLASNGSTSGGGSPHSEPMGEAPSPPFDCSDVSRLTEAQAAASGIVFEHLETLSRGGGGEEGGEVTSAPDGAGGGGAADFGLEYPETFERVYRVNLPVGEWGVCVEPVVGSGAFEPAGRVFSKGVSVQLPPRGDISACQPFTIQITGAGSNVSLTSLELRSGVNSTGQCCGGLPGAAPTPPSQEGAQGPGQIVSTFAQMTLPVGSALEATFNLPASIQQNLLLCLRTPFEDASPDKVLCLEAGALGGGVSDTACYTPQPTVLSMDRRIGGAIDPASPEEVDQTSVALILVALLVAVLLCLALTWRCCISDGKSRQKRSSPAGSATGSKSAVTSTHIRPAGGGAQPLGGGGAGGVVVCAGGGVGGEGFPGKTPALFSPLDMGKQLDNPVVSPRGVGASCVLSGCDATSGRGGSGSAGRGGGAPPGKPLLNSFCSASNPAFLSPLPKVTLYGKGRAEGGAVGGGGGVPPPASAGAPPPAMPPLHPPQAPLYQQRGAHGGGAMAGSPRPAPTAASLYTSPSATPPCPAVSPPMELALPPNMMSPPQSPPRRMQSPVSQSHVMSSLFAVPQSLHHTLQSHEVADDAVSCVSQTPTHEVQSPALPPEVGNEEEVVLKRRWGELLRGERFEFEQGEFADRSALEHHEAAERGAMRDQLAYQQNVVESLRQRAVQLEEREHEEQITVLRQAQHFQEHREQEDAEVRRNDKKATDESDEMLRVAQAAEARRREADEQERQEMQATMERERERVAQREAEEARRERAEGERHIQRQKKDWELDVHRALGRVQREEEKRRRSNQSDEEFQRDKLAILAKDALHTVQGLLDRVAEQSTGRRKAEMEQVRHLVAFEGERRDAEAEAEQGERARISTLHVSETLKREQIEDLLHRQKRLEDDRHRERERLKTENESMQVMVQESKRALEQDRLRLEEEKILMRAEKRAQAEEVRIQRMEGEQKRAEEAMLLAHRSAQARCDEERLADERHRLEREKHGMDEWRKAMESNLRESEEEAAEALKQKEIYEKELQRERDNAKGYWLQQVGVVRGESQQRRSLELEACGERDAQLSAFRQSAEDAAARTLHREGLEGDVGPSPAEALAALAGDAGPTDTPAQRMKESAVSVLCALELLTPLRLGPPTDPPA